MKEKLVFILIIFIFASCISNKQDGKEYNICFQEKCDTPAKSLLDISFIKLETNENCLIGAISQVQKVNDKIFILDNKRCLVYVFDEDGNYIAQVGNVGSSPGEYIMPSYFRIDESGNRIEILDRSINKIVCYSLIDFAFISDTKVSFNTSCFGGLPDNNLIFNNLEYISPDSVPQFNFLVVDSAFNKLNEYVEKEFKSGYLMGDLMMLYSIDDKILGYTPFEGTVYQLSADSVIPIYNISFGAHKLAPLSFLRKESNNGENNYREALIGSDYISYYTIRENHGDVCVPYIVKETQYIGFYNKNEKKTYNYTLNHLNESLSLGEIPYVVYGSIGEYHVAPLNLSVLKGLSDNNYKFLPPLDGLLEMSTEDDNPILCLFKMKSYAN